MVAITATNATTPSAQVWQSRSRLQQAREEADRAESNARQLRAQADQAEQQAQQGQARVSALSTQVAAADSTYSAQFRNKVASAEARQTQDVLAPVATVAGNNFTFPDNPLRPDARLWSVVNQARGSGRFVNLLA